MKKIILLITALGILTGCSSNYWRADIIKWDNRTPLSLSSEIFQKITYIKDIDDYWQSPGYTEFEKTGDCEDHVLLFMDLLSQIGHESSFVKIKINKNTYHAITFTEGEYYDPTSGKRITIKQDSIEEIYSFRQAMRRIDKL